MSTNRWEHHFGRGDHASRPAAGDMPAFAFYYCTDHKIWYQTDGSAWGTYIDVGADGGGGGGGITQAYVGKNAIGASVTGMLAQKVFLKKITLAEARLVTNIEAYITAAVEGATGHLAAGIWADSAGAPDQIIAYNYPSANTLVPDEISGAGGLTPRWFGVPIGKWLTAGDYWLGMADQDTTTDFNLAYDATVGADRHMTPGGFFSDAGFTTVTTTTDDYSIRANTIR